MISESPKTFKYCTLRLIALYKPWTRASYSAVLLVHSNSNLQDSIVLSPFGLTKMQPAPEPSLDLEPSKYKDQNKGVLTVVFTTFSLSLKHLDICVCEKFSI